MRVSRSTALSRLSRWPTLWISVRYLRAVRQTRSVSLISVISILGLLLGVAALVTVMSVMNGFDRELRTRILGIVPHVTIQPEQGEQLPALLERAGQMPGVRETARFMETGAMVTTGSRVMPVAVFGIEPEREPVMSPLADSMVAGDLQDLSAEGGLVMGAPLASRLGLFPGDRVTLLLPRSVAGSVQPMLLTAELVGLFRLGAEPDHGLVFLHVDRLIDTPGIAPLSGRIALESLYQAPAMRRALADALELPDTAVSDWSARHGELFDAVGMEKTMMGLLLSLIVAIAVFNIVASLAMVVDQKRSAIAILQTLGLTRLGVVRIFVLQGMLIGTLGVAAGLLLGTVLALNISEWMAALEQLFGFRLLAGTYFDVLPSELRGGDLLWIGLGAWLMAALGACYPAWRAGSVAPARALHG